MMMIFFCWRLSDAFFWGSSLVAVVQSGSTIVSAEGAGERPCPAVLSLSFSLSLCLFAENGRDEIRQCFLSASATKRPRGRGGGPDCVCVSSTLPNTEDLVAEYNQNEWNDSKFIIAIAESIKTKRKKKRGAGRHQWPAEDDDDEAGPPIANLVATSFHVKWKEIIERQTLHRSKKVNRNIRSGELWVASLHSTPPSDQRRAGSERRTKQKKIDCGRRERSRRSSRSLLLLRWRLSLFLFFLFLILRFSFRVVFVGCVVFGRFSAAVFF